MKLPANSSEEYSVIFATAFAGRSLSVAGSSQMVVNPDVSEAHTLRGWYDSEGANMEFNSYRNEGGQGAGAGGKIV